MAKTLAAAGRSGWTTATTALESSFDPAAHPAPPTVMGQLPIRSAMVSLRLMRAFIVLNTKGGVGKTTVACGLAAAFARRGHATIALDADPQGSLTNWFGLADRRGLVDTLRGSLDPGFAAIRVAKNFRVLPTGDAVELEAIARRRMGEIPPYPRELQSDILVIDTAAGVSGLTDAFLSWFDPEIIVPLPVSGGYLPLAALERVWRYLGERLGREPDYIVPNMLDWRTSNSGLAMAELQRDYADFVVAPIRVNASLAHATWRHASPADRKSVTDFGRLAEVVYRRWGYDPREPSTNGAEAYP